MTNYATQQQNDDMVSLLASQFRLLYNPTHAFADAISMLKMFPGLVGLWPGWITNGSGNVVDISGNGNHLTRSGLLVDAATELFGRLFFGATTSNASHVDAAIFDILGTESHISSGIRGLTIGLWIRPNAIGTTQIFMSKYLSASDRAYWLNINAAGNAQFSISNTGSDSFDVFGSPLSAGNYYNVVGRFTPSSELSVWVNGVESVNTTSIPASIFNSTGPFRLGQRGDSAAAGASNRSLLHFLCAASVSDQFIKSYYQMTAPLFNVSI